RERSEDERLPSLAAYAAERHAFELHAVLAHEGALHPLLRAEPEDAPAACEQLARDRKPGEHVAAGSAGRDHHGAGHAVNPLSRRRFWLRPAAAAALTCAVRKLVA